MRWLSCHFGVDGADRDRTGDPLLAKQVLSQLSYRPEINTAAKLNLIPHLTKVGGVQESVKERAGSHAFFSRSSAPPNTTDNIVPSSGCW